MARRWWTPAAERLHASARYHDRERGSARYRGGFHASLGDLHWVIVAYALTLAALLLTVGSLADLYGRRLSSLRGSSSSPRTRLRAGSLRPAVDEASLAR